MKIPSVKRVFSKYYYLFWILLTSVIEILLIYGVVTQPVKPTLKFLFPAFGLFMCFSAVWPYYWLVKGFEILEFDKIKNSFQFYRQGLFKFHVKKGSLSDLTAFSLNVTNTGDFIQDGSGPSVEMGTIHGKLQFTIRRRKKVEFGAGLSDEEAKEIEMVVKDFLKQSPSVLAINRT